MMLYMINLGYSRTDQVVGLHVPQNQSFQQTGKKKFNFDIIICCSILRRHITYSENHSKFRHLFLRKKKILQHWQDIILFLYKENYFNVVQVIRIILQELITNFEQNLSVLKNNFISNFLMILFYNFYKEYVAFSFETFSKLQSFKCKRTNTLWNIFAHANTHQRKPIFKSRSHFGSIEWRNYECREKRYDYKN